MSTPTPQSLPTCTSERLATAGRLFFASALLFWGIQHLYFGEFVTRAMPAWPSGIPLRAAWPYVIGAVFVIGGSALLTGKWIRPAALLVGTIVMGGALVLAVPNAFSHTRLGGLWTHAGKAFVIAGGALLIAAIFSGAPPRPIDRTFRWTARVTFGGFLILAGLQHFVWVQFVQTLVPSWLPGAAFWTYFTAVALILGGIGIIVPVTTRLAALFSGAMIFAWVWMVHVPRALVTVRDANEATALFEAIAFTGVACLLAARDPHVAPIFGDVDRLTPQSTASLPSRAP